MITDNLLFLFVVFTPFISGLLCLSFKLKFSWIAPILSAVLMLVTVIGSIVLYFQFETDLLYSIPWFYLNGQAITLSIVLNKAVLTMAVVVIIISFLVHLFSIGYMADDQNIARYFALLGIFTFAMLGMVVSNNLLLLFCFWELVGFCSYRLIGHWHEKPMAARAATKAFLINKTGDLGFLVGLMIIWSATGNLEINALDQVETSWLTVAGICIFLGVVGKSAQFPLLNWLPDAMTGPTPVSALIHAATMVAAGVYLIFRLSPFFTPATFEVISLVGAITALLGAIGALVQFDIKKILAYSTVSQLGFMILGIGIGAVEGGFQHLLHHAFFKAGLFLGAGSIIHAMNQAIHHGNSDFDVTDIRNVGGLFKSMPVTFWSFLICAAALAGLPLTNGFISKEIILTTTLEDMSTPAGLITTCAAWIVTLLSPIYTFRLVWYLFGGRPNHNLSVQEVPVIMQVPLLLLAAGSLTFIFKDGHLTSVTNSMLKTNLHGSSLVMYTSLILIGIGFGIGYFLYRHKPLTTWGWLLPQLYLDQLNTGLIKLTGLIARLTSAIDKKGIDTVLHGFAYLQVAFAFVIHWIDQYVVDGVVNGSATASRGIGVAIRSTVNGKIQSYLLWAMAGLLIFILWILT